MPLKGAHVSQKARQLSLKATKMPLRGARVSWKATTLS